jgi:hypothetical protein
MPSLAGIYDYAGGDRLSFYMNYSVMLPFVFQWIVPLLDKLLNSGKRVINLVKL